MTTFPSFKFTSIKCFRPSNFRMRKKRLTGFRPSRIDPKYIDPKYSRDHFDTRAVHAGQIPDGITGAVVPALSLSTTFVQEAAGVHKGFEYSRSGNPTRAAFETAVASLEGAKHCLAFASGSVTTATVLNLLQSGSHVIAVNDVYGGTFRYLTNVANSNGIQVDFVDMFDPENVRRHLKTNTRLIWVESPTNPTLRLVDIAAVAKIAHSHPNCILVVDNTFMSPYFQNPLNLGADIVVHSVTKYINGHSDVVMGVAVTNSDPLFKRLAFLQNSIGGVPSPFDCFLANRGCKTLAVRMRQHQENALFVAHYLESSPFVERVIYPGLKSHPQHELALKQCSGFSGMVSFRIKDGNLARSNKFLSSLRLFCLAESLGCVESLAELPAVMTHASLTPEVRKSIGVDDGLIRLSVGVEDKRDLINDLGQALEKAMRVTSKL
ncbi:Cys/Met metabolism PLP-dependent enzyme-domain-containing protein [Obelidium mucronatum]|nr:Cys/Met metabolism PLP-dependent enzyme-domain-containing protein [Obelidium mucronatum]